MLKLSLLIFAASILMLGGYAQRHALKCEFIEYSDYSEIDTNIFVSPHFNFNQKEILLSRIKQGQARVNNTFGNMSAKPKLLITTNESEAANFGSNLYGNALLTPLGECLTLGPQGQNVDVIAHEYMHAEVHHRVGWFNHWLNVPIWFNEGVALLVDFRSVYLLENIDLSLQDVNAVKRDGFDFSVSSYQASRILVDDIDKSKLYLNLEKMKQGQDLNSAFSF